MGDKQHNKGFENSNSWIWLMIMLLFWANPNGDKNNK